MSDAFGPFAIGDKAMALCDLPGTDLMTGDLVKGQTYTIRDWHIGHTLDHKGNPWTGQMVNVVGIVGDMVPLNAGGVHHGMVEYGWCHTCFRKVWSVPESVAVAASETLQAVT